MTEKRRRHKPVLAMVVLLLLGGAGLLLRRGGLTGRVIGEDYQVTDEGATIHWTKNRPIPFVVNQRVSADVDAAQ